MNYDRTHSLDRIRELLEQRKLHIDDVTQAMGVRWSDRQLAKLVQELEGKTRNNEQVAEEITFYRDQARDLASDGELEIDDDAAVSIGSDEGAYVQMWQWIPNPRLGEDAPVTSEEEGKA